MEAWEKKLLRKHYSFLLRSLDPETVRIALYSNDLLTWNEHEQIKAQTTPVAANERILEALNRRAPGTLERFCRILEEEGGHPNVIEKLRSGRHIAKDTKIITNNLNKINQSQIKFMAEVEALKYAVLIIYGNIS